MSGSRALGGEPGVACAPTPGTAEPPAEVVLSIEALSKSYGTTVALDCVDLTIRRGELVTLLGPSGSGKTTLLKVIAGFEAPDAGRVLLRGQDISRLSPARREVGMVFQHYALFPHMTVSQNIGYGLKLRRAGRAQRERRVAEMLALLRLQGLGERYPRQLSGGQQQRVALGRALAYDPEVILMDEPLGALDRSLRIELEEQIRSVHRELGATIVYVTHDQQEALALSDRIAVMRDGRVAGVGRPTELYRLPTDGFVASFFAGANLLAVERHELLEGGRALVRCAGSEVNCPSTSTAAGAAVATASAAAGATTHADVGAVALAVRRRSLRRESRGDALRVSGTVTEMLLFGDEQEIALHTKALGRVVAVLDVRDCVGIALGRELELFAPGDEVVLVDRA